MKNQQKVSDCWKYFIKVGKDIAACNLCNKQLACKKSSTTGLNRHLENIHSLRIIPRPNLKPTAELKRPLKNIHSLRSSSRPIVKTEPNLDVPKPKQTKNIKPSLLKPPKILALQTKRSELKEIVSELAAKDGLTLSQICKSEIIHASLKTQGHTLSREPRDVMNLILEYFEDVKLSVVNKIHKMKLQNKKASISIDECTILRNRMPRRFLNVRVHYSDGDSDNLGLVRINGRSTSENIFQSVEERLEEFRLDYQKDIVGTTTAGESVMVKFGNLSPSLSQLCYNDAIHLAVVSVLYVDKCDSEESSEDDFYSNDDCFGGGDDDFCDSSNKNTKFSLIHTSRLNIFDTIKAIRSIVKMFRKPLEKYILQKNIGEVECEELTLLLDCHTRWTSMETMVESFLRVLQPIQEALLHFEMSHMWNPEYTANARSILNALKLVRIAVEALSRKDANILISEGILKFLFNALQKENTNLSQILLEEIKNQISLRRCIATVSLIKFLEDPTKLYDDDTFFASASLVDVTKLATNVMNRLFKSTDQIKSHDSDSNDSETYVVPDLPHTMSLGQQLEASIEECFKKSKQKPPVNDVERNISLYLTTGQLTQNLEKLKEALQTIQPTSTQNARNFSISGNIITGQKNRFLSDKSVNALWFLKQYFLNKGST